MKEIVPNDYEDMTVEQYSNALKEVSSKHPEKYKFIIKGGASLHNALIHLFSTVWRTEVIPDLWINTELVQLWKGKGDKNSMSSQRFCTSKNVCQKCSNIS